MTGYEQRLRQAAGQAETEAGLTLQVRGGVRIRAAGDLLRCTVADQPVCEVVLDASGARCDCPVFAERGGCRHAVAAARQARRDGLLEGLLRRSAETRGRQLMEVLDTELAESRTLRLEPELLPEDGFRLGLRVGETRLYAVRSLADFMDARRSGQRLFFGKGFTYEPAWMRFSEEAEALLRLLQALCDTQAAAGIRPDRWLILPESAVPAVLEKMTGMTARVTAAGETRTVTCMAQRRIPLRFHCAGSLRALTLEAEVPEGLIPVTPDHAWLLWEDGLFPCDPAQQPLLRCVDAGGRFGFSGQVAVRALAELLPRLGAAGTVTIDRRLEAHLCREPLEARVYLDRAEKDVAAQVVFRYGAQELNPFSPDRDALTPGGRILLRDGEGEKRVLDTLDQAGFRVRKNGAVLSGQDAIWRFVSGGADALRQVAEVWLSNEFKRILPRKPRLSAGMSLRGGRLALDLRADGEPTPEILDIMRAIARKRAYFQLRDGSFLDLTDLAAWQPAAEQIAEAGEASLRESDGAIDLAAYRLVYLNTLLKEAGLEAETDDTAKEALRLLSREDEENPDMPEGLALRPYQRSGFRWLSTLDRLRMGGILADDMGLGKTVQLIALLKHVRAPGCVSLVVAPTSLTYNWLHEFSRFAPELSVTVLSGTQTQRARLLEHVQRAQDVDVLITSYPQVRRDIGLLAEIPFRVAALDEAQQIKNADSAGAAAVKQLKAESRFALTGTPLENHAGEIWSLFDFVLPGFLGTAAAFQRQLEAEPSLAGLRRKMQPFLRRRLKKAVLPELPDKTEHTLTAPLTPEQADVYEAARLRLGRQVDRALTERGLGRSGSEILAAITELREVCCHPSLVMEGYAGSSGKLDLLLDLLPGALAQGRRVLLFSQFTRMLKLIRRQLEAEDIRCLYLDGETPAARRLAMCDAFNAGEGDVFLVSLKAGGTGLNLTGADLVIHYDPWWNPAAEDQATDRTHRIGLTHKVEVIRLMTHGTVEEQVVALGERKRALFDRLVTPGETLVTALSEQDIRNLFR